MREAALILIVEDDDDTRATAADALRAAGYEVAEARGVREAKDAVASRRPDAVILDRRLGDGDGLDLAKSWRERGPTVTMPIIVLTGYSMRADVEAALVAGCDAFLTKPCPAKVLLIHVEKAVAESPDASVEEGAVVMADEPEGFPRSCGCGREWTRETWKTLKLVGRDKADSPEPLEFRVYACGSTISVRLDAVERSERSS